MDLVREDLHGHHDRNNGTVVATGGTHTAAGRRRGMPRLPTNKRDAAGSGTVTLAADTGVTFTADGDLSPGTSVGTLTFTFAGTTVGLTCPRPPTIPAR